MRAVAILLATGLLAFAGCGGDDEETATNRGDDPSATPGEERPGGRAEADDRKGKRERGTRITLGASEFGEMLFGSDEQAIYVFENDREGKSVCYGECAEAWPPVLTDGKPLAGNGVNEELLGTAERDGGKLQATYAGKPLYFYANEGPGEVRCHNVDLNGGLWWVIGPDGEPRP